MKCTTSADCPWVNELRLLDEHLNTCGYVLMPCGNGCGDHSVRDKLHHHYTEVCPLRQYTCVHCKEVGTYKEIISSHLDVCPDAIVPCPNSGCGANIKRRDITSHHSVCPEVMVPCPNSGCGAAIKRKDTASHCSECQFETIACVYMNIGCTFTSPRHQMADHKASSSGFHLDLAMMKLKKQGEDLIMQLIEQNQKHIEEIMTQQKDQRQQHVEDMLQLKQHSDKNVEKMVTQVELQHRKQLEEIKQLKEEKVEEIDKLFCMMRKITDLKPSEEHVVLKMSSFEQHRVNNTAWYSPGFYTHPHGYKMCLKVNANGNAEGEGTHMSVYLYPMKGDHDDNLIWPLRYKCAITLLNQLMDSDHHTIKFTYSKDEMDQHNSRVVATGKKASARTTALDTSSGRGYHQFIALDQLGLHEKMGQQQQYLMDDCLYFRVQIDVLPPPKPWLVVN